MSIDLFELLSQLISIPSMSGDEAKIITFLDSFASSYKWKTELISVAPGRSNLLITFGEPRILFTTHVDVVSAPSALYKPRIVGEQLFGRGACDAKGIAVAMLAACQELERSKKSDFALLLVVGEEVDGIGAKIAANQLKGRGIKFLINGEPTDCRLISAHKGNVEVKIAFSGRACHSGYPELGEDANSKLLRCANILLNTEFGFDLELGNATVNIGLLNGGVGANSISSTAEMCCSVRTVSDNEIVIEKLQQLSPERAAFEVKYNCPLSRMVVLLGFEIATVSFCTDIPNFQELEASALLYGPGSINVAHTDNENISYAQLTKAIAGYVRIFDQLRSQHHFHPHSH